METTEHDGAQGIFFSTHDWDGELADSECFGDQAFQSLAWQWQSEEFVSLDLFGQCRLHVFDDISCGGKPIYTVDWVSRSLVLRMQRGVLTDTFGKYR